MSQFRPQPVFLAKQHSLRVVLDALLIGHALRDQSWATCKGGLQVRTHCGVKPETVVFNAIIRKFRTVAREGAWHLKSLVAQRQTSPLVQPTSKNKKGAA